MGENGDMGNVLASDGEIERTLEFARSKDFFRLLVFADSVSRYASIATPGRGLGLKLTALIILTRRGGSLTASQWAIPLLRSNDSMTGLIDDLENDGLVRRYRVTSDRRKVDVRITAKGLAFLKEYLDHVDASGAAVMSSLDERELRLLAGFSNVLRMSMIVQLGKADDQTFYLRAQAYKDLGHKDRALVDLERCIEISEDESLIEKARQELREIGRRNARARKPIAV